jgi:hypothetical protein
MKGMRTRMKTMRYFNRIYRLVRVYIFVPVSIVGLAIVAML